MQEWKSQVRSMRSRFKFLFSHEVHRVTFIPSHSSSAKSTRESCYNKWRRRGSCPELLEKKVDSKCDKQVDDTTVEYHPHNPPCDLKVNNSASRVLSLIYAIVFYLQRSTQEYGHLLNKTIQSCHYILRPALQL